MDRERVTPWVCRSVFWFVLGKVAGLSACTAVQRRVIQGPPGNRLEALEKDLKGLHSIRVNDQWRIVFEWTDQGPAQVRIMDYH